MSRLRVRTALALSAAVLAILGIAAAFTDPLVVLPVVGGLLGPAGAFALVVALQPTGGDWSNRRRSVAVILAVAWSLAALVLAPLSFAVPACICPEAETSRALLSVRTVVTVAYFGGPILLVLAALIPTRVKRLAQPAT